VRLSGPFDSYSGAGNPRGAAGSRGQSPEAEADQTQRRSPAGEQVRGTQNRTQEPASGQRQKRQVGP